MSGRRTIRKASSKPTTPAMSGTSSATWSARGRASVLMRMISSWVAWRLTGEQLLELGVAHDLGILLQRIGDLLLLRPERARCCLPPCW